MVNDIHSYRCRILWNSVMLVSQNSLNYLHSLKFCLPPTRSSSHFHKLFIMLSYSLIKLENLCRSFLVSYNLYLYRHGQLGSCKDGDVDRCVKWVSFVGICINLTASWATRTSFNSTLILDVFRSTLWLWLVVSEFSVSSIDNLLKTN